MKKFLVQLCLVPLPFALVVAAISWAAYKVEIKAMEREFILPEGVVAAVVGDSRAETTFDPEELPFLQNFGKSAMPLGVTLEKARMIAKANPSLKMMVIDIWPKPFFENVEKPFGSDGLAVPKGIALMELATRRCMPPFGDGFEIRFKDDVLLPGLKRMLGVKKKKGKGRNPTVGKFARNHKFITDLMSADSTLKPPARPEDLPATPTAGELALEDLVGWLNARNIKVVLTTTPLLWYENRYSPEAREYFTKRMKEIASAHGAKWLNWIDEFQDDMGLWADGCHLNDIGAGRLSREKRGELEAILREP